MCTMGLALGKDIQTDCSINAQVQGKTYCFGSKEAMTEFMKNPKGNLTKAQTYYSKKHPGKLGDGQPGPFGQSTLTQFGPPLGGPFCIETHFSLKFSTLAEPSSGLVSGLIFKA